MIFNPVYGGDTSATLGTKSIVANGTYNASSDNLDGYSSVDVTVPNTYSASDEGKVVDNGALVAQTSRTITSNDTYDTTTNDEVVVDVPNSYSASDEGKVVSNGALIAQTSATYTSNDTYDTTLINSVTVNVSGGSPMLITKTITANGTYDASDDNADGYSQVVVNVSGGGGATFGQAVSSVLPSVYNVSISAKEKP